MADYIRTALLLEFRVILKSALDKLMNATVPKGTNVASDIFFRLCIRCVAGILAIIVLNQLDLDYLAVRSIMIVMAACAVVGFLMLLSAAPRASDAVQKNLPK